MTKRVIAHMDLDCFYVQVERRENPSLQDRPVGVIQYGDRKSLIAVSYDARLAGVKRGMKGDIAKKLCPDISLVKVPVINNKSNMQKYRLAGEEVMSTMAQLSTACEKASVDEAYVDVTNEAHKRLKTCTDDELREALASSFIVGFTKTKDNLGSEGAAIDRSVCKDQDRDGVDAQVAWIQTPEDRFLAAGALVVAEIRQAVKEKCKFTVSAGIGGNKMLAKLVSGMHKPDKQTIIPQASIPRFFSSLPLEKINGLGGKLGVTLQSKLQVKYITDVLRYSEAQLQQWFSARTAAWLRRAAQGLDDTPVSSRTTALSLSCSKTFSGTQCLTTFEKITHWIRELANELGERLDTDMQRNHRRFKTLVLSYTTQKPNRTSLSRSCSLRYGIKAIGDDACALAKKYMGGEKSPRVTVLGLCASGGTEVPTQAPITEFLAKKGSKATNSSERSLIQSSPDRDHHFIRTRESAPGEGEHPSKRARKASSKPTLRNIFKKIEQTNNDSHSSTHGAATMTMTTTADLNPEEIQEHVCLEKNRDDNWNSEPLRETTPTSIPTPATIAPLSTKQFLPLIFICDRCGEKFAVNTDFQSHKDFHLAQDLQRQERTLHPASAANNSQLHENARNTGARGRKKSGNQRVKSGKSGALLKFLERE
eukprot:m.61188 g.61188  ORF g.61188 m.61188 type:complete len:650 (+) comp19253_c0_seq2:53-2002(+)